jgi:mannose-6-phosphate isomerase
MKPYPLTLSPILKEKVWGGRRLERLGKGLAPDASVGESWELADLASTSAEGGGGGEARSVIASGEMRGLTLADAITAMGHNLMGSLRLSPAGGFPLLAKYLDARENLSVQVHPSPAYAAAHPEAHLKTESWYIVDAVPGAVIYKGIRQGVTREAFAAKLRACQNIVDDLIAVPANPGDFHHLPSGTCHALGAGVLVAEVQTPSDTTFRIYDWGRTGRAMHIEQALECIHFGPPPRTAPVRSDGSPRFKLVETDSYHLFELRPLGGTESAIENVPPFPDGGPMVWMVIRGEGRIESTAGDHRPVEFHAGSTILFPAATGPSRSVITRDATIIEVRFPKR